MNDQINEQNTSHPPIEGAGPQSSLETNPSSLDIGDDIDISNKGQRMVVLLIIIVLVAGGIAAFVMYSKKQGKIDELDKLRTDFATYHNTGYEDFWKAAKLDLDVMKNNMDFEAKITEYLSVSSIAYTRHLKEKAIPVLEKAIPKYRSLEAAGIILPELKATTHSLTKLQEAWQKFISDVSMYENYLENRSKLTEAGEQWAGAQSSPKEGKFTLGAVRYLKTVNCILQQKGKTVIDYHPADLSLRVKDTCALADEQAQWFKKVAFECLDNLGKDAEADIIYEETLKKYAEVEGLNQDTKSVFGINNCLDLTRKAFETELSNSIVKAWADYGQKKNALLKAIEKRKKEI